MSIRYEDTIDFGPVISAMEAAIPEALMNGAEVLRAVTTPKVPVLTGHLVGSGATRLIDAKTAALEYDGPYARYQEFGVFYRHGRVGAPLSHTHGMSFFLTTSVVEAKSAVIEAIADVIWEAM